MLSCVRLVYFQRFSHRSLKKQMGEDGTKHRILDRLCESYNQIILRGKRHGNGEVHPIPLRERTALNVVGEGLIGFINRVGAKMGYRSPNGTARIVGGSF
jgi:hypothetical protein